MRCGRILGGARPTQEKENFAKFKTWTQPLGTAGFAIYWPHSPLETPYSSPLRWRALIFSVQAFNEWRAVSPGREGETKARWPQGERERAQGAGLDLGPDDCARRGRNDVKGVGGGGGRAADTAPPPPACARDLKVGGCQCGGHSSEGATQNCQPQAPRCRTPRATAPGRPSEPREPHPRGCCSCCCSDAAREPA